MTEPQYSSFEADNGTTPEQDVWRKEIHARLDRFRTRRGRRVEGAYSMRFPFPPAADEAASTPPPETALEAATSREQLQDLENALPAEKSLEYHVAALATRPGFELSSEMPNEAKEQIAATVQQMIAEEAEEAAPVDRQPETAPQAAAVVAQVTPGPFEPFNLSAAEAVETAAPAPPRPRLKRKVIAFPRHLMAVPETAYQLAEPVLPEQPRILDVPEELEAVSSTPFLEGLRFDRASQTPEATQHPALPITPAPLSRRLYAACLDALVVAVGCAAFGGAAYKIMGLPTPGKSMVAMIAVVPALLWFAYHYLFLLYGGATPGMRLAGLQLSTFEGKAVGWSRRRWRALSLAFSTASLAMGLLWAFADVDGLCWHDRISQTYLISA